VQAVLHAVPGVLGVVALALDGVAFTARKVAARYELLVPAGTPDLQGVAA
jgi:hypothetical protein